MKKTIICAFTGMSLLLAVQCTNPNKAAKQSSALADEEIEMGGANAFESSFTAPSPEEIMSLFENSSLEFKAGALNNPESVSKYLSSKALSENLGVYVIDAAYLNLFKQYSLIPGYLESVFKITDKLEIEGIYQVVDYKKLLTQAGNPDSLIAISEGMYQAIVNFMIENENETMLCLITHGSFIEMMHLTLESVKVFKADDPILQGITDQYMYLDNLYAYAQQFDAQPDIHEMLSQLSALKAIWNEVEHTEKKSMVSKTSDGKMSLQGGVKFKITEEQFTKLRNLVNEIRNKITA